MALATAIRERDEAHPGSSTAARPPGRDRPTIRPVRPPHLEQHRRDSGNGPEFDDERTLRGCPGERVQTDDRGFGIAIYDLLLATRPITEPQPIDSDESSRVDGRARGSEPGGRLRHGSLRASPPLSGITPVEYRRIPRRSGLRSSNVRCSTAHATRRPGRFAGPGLLHRSPVYRTAPREPYRTESRCEFVRLRPFHRVATRRYDRPSIQAWLCRSDGAHALPICPAAIGPNLLHHPGQ